MLAQTVAIKELIIADDGSEGPVRGMLEEFAALPRVRVLWRSHVGNPGAMRNAAIREATGTYIAFADSDDAWYPEKLERQFAALRARPECRWSYTSCSHIDAQDQPLPALDAQQRAVHAGTLVETLAQCLARVPLPSVLAERTLLCEAGLFEESMRCYADYDLWIRLAARSAAVAIPEPLVKVRLHAAHFSRGHAFEALSGHRRFLERALPLVHSPPVRASVLRALALDVGAPRRTRGTIGGSRGSDLQTGRLIGGWLEHAALVADCRAHAFAALGAARPPDLDLPTVNACARSRSSGKS